MPRTGWFFLPDFFFTSSPVIEESRPGAVFHLSIEFRRGWTGDGRQGKRPMAKTCSRLPDEPGDQDYPA